MGTASVTPVTDVQKTLPGVLDWPGLRTFRSPRFRLVVALALWLLATAVLGVVLLKQASDPAGQYAFDFQVYHAAAGDLSAGRSPYAPSMFAGPIAAQGALLYKYPPVLAQLLIPLAGASLSIAAAVWLILQALLILSGTWLAARVAGAPRTAETLCWCGAAATLFLPDFDTVWKGNVSGVLAFFVALSFVGGAGGGLGLAAATLLKTTPVVMLPAAFVSGQRFLRGLAVAALVTLVSVLLAPYAWADFVRVLPNLVSGPANFATNLAPDNLVSFALPAMPMAAEVVRLACVVIGMAAVVLSVLVARRAGGWPAALALGVVALVILPSATWYHYLAVLLPVAAYTWPRATARARLGLVTGGASVSFGLAWLPLAVAGATLLLATAVWTLWPRRQLATP